MKEIQKAIDMLEKKFSESRDSGKLTVLSYKEYKYICATLVFCDRKIYECLLDENGNSCDN
jgi:hypothetical protein